MNHADYPRICTGCGQEITHVQKKWPARCAQCIREWEHEKYREKHPLKKRYVRAGSEIRVLAVSPAVTDKELRWLQSAYVGSIFSQVDFNITLTSGAFDGLLIEQAGRRYEVWAGRKVEPGQVQTLGMGEGA